MEQLHLNKKSRHIHLTINVSLGCLMYDTDQTNLCSNPSEDNVIYLFLILVTHQAPLWYEDFQPISINISIGHKVSTNQGTVQDPAADGDST